MSENGEKCQSLFPKVQGDSLKCLLLSRATVHNPKTLSQETKETRDIHILKSGNKNFENFDISS